MVASDTVLTFSLIVTDDEGAVSAPDTVNITVKPVPAHVTLRGRVLYERVPLDFRGLRYPDLSFDEVGRRGAHQALDAATQERHRQRSIRGRRRTHRARRDEYRVACNGRDIS